MRSRRSGWPATGWPRTAADVATTTGVRRRLTALASLVTAVVLVCSAVALLLLAERSLEDNADDLARTRARDLAAQVASSSLSSELGEIGDDSVAQVVAQGGEVLAASPNLGDAGPISREQPDGDEPEVMVIEAPDDDEIETYRVWALSADGPGGPATVYVGSSTEAIEEAVGALRAPLVLGIPLVLVLATGLVWILVGRTLRPVEEAHQRQRAFVADAAHELQSPLGSLRAQIEVALQHPASTDWPGTARDLLADSDRMERLVRDLLFLARQDESLETGRLVDLDDVTLEEVARSRGGSDVAISTDRVSAGPVRGDRDDLSRLVRNLLANAVHYAASSVTVECGVEGEWVVLRVADDGPGVPPGAADRIFDRFYRADPSRGHSGSAGLGLAIARAVAERHGGSLRLLNRSPGAEFEVRLPAG